MCVCLPGYVGSQCQASACDSNPCQNTGRCALWSEGDIRSEEGYYCECVAPYVGRQCELCKYIFPM